jgi:L-ascorbate metabolism protein UlaG (beta-lactamase superfamily)
MHYNTWDIIKADPAEFRRLVGHTSAVTILKPGESYTLP